MPLSAYVVSSLLISNIAMYGVGGLIHWWYFKHKAGQEQEWKIQPDRQLSRKLAKEGFWISVFNMNLVSLVGAVVVWMLLEKGWGKLYFSVDPYGWGYLVLSAAAYFMFIETCAYYSHVALHKGWLYERFHSKHHRYKTPEWYTLGAMDPIEWLFHSSYLLLPAFIFPLHPIVFFPILIYSYLCGFWDHIGAKLPFNLPIHGGGRFHDDHHKYVHVNFGFLCSIYDRIHDTMRREGHHYIETSFAGGKGVVRDFDAIKEQAAGPRISY